MLVDEAAAIAVASIFGVCLVGAVINFRITKFRLYLLSGLSTLLRLVGFSFNAAYFSDVGNRTVPNNDFLAVYFVLSAAGLSIAFAVHIIVMTCWFKNASEPSQPPFAKKFNLRIAVRWIILPFITFGPLIGIAYTVLVYAYPTPSHLETANTLRHVIRWGIFATSILITSIVIMAVYYSTTSSKRGVKEPQLGQERLVRISLLCCCLLLLPVVFGVVSLYNSKYVLNPNYFYPLSILPALIEQVIITIPRLLARIGLASRYDEFCKERDELKEEKKLGGVLNVFKTFKKTGSSLVVTDASSGSSVVHNGSGNGVNQENIV